MDFRAMMNWNLYKMDLLTFFLLRPTGFIQTYKPYK